MHEVDLAVRSTLRSPERAQQISWMAGFVAVRAGASEAKEPKNAGEAPVHAAGGGAKLRRAEQQRGGAGEGIRTLDVNLGKEISGSMTWAFRGVESAGGCG